MTDRADGQGALAVSRVGAATVVERASARSPLKLVVTRNHGAAAWVFAASFGGGLVDGDTVELAIEVGAGAALLVGTQASTKVYRSPRGCRQRVTAAVGDGGLLVLLPDPVVCFAGARYQQEVAVDLAAGGSLILLDGLTSGRAARGERWAFARYASRIAAGPVCDAVEIDPAHGELAARMGRFDALATLLALGPRAAPIADSLRAAAPPLGRRADLLIAPSPLAGGAIARVAGRSVEEVALAVRGLLKPLPDLLGDDPFARKF